LLDLAVSFILELCNFSTEIFHVQLIKHNYVMITVFAEQALEANAAEVVLAEGFYVFGHVDFAFLVSDSKYRASVLGVTVFCVKF